MTHRGSSRGILPRAFAVCLREYFDSIYGDECAAMGAESKHLPLRGLAVEATFDPEADRSRFIVVPRN